MTLQAPKFLAALAVAAVMGCQGGLIPTPSGNEELDLSAAPDETKVLTSALTSDTEEEKMVVVGLAGAVQGAGTLAIHVPRTEITLEFQTHDDGSFTALANARADDTLELRFTGADGDQSAAATLEAAGYAAEPTESDDNTDTGTDGPHNNPAKATAQPIKPGSAVETEEPDGALVSLAWENDSELKLVGKPGYILADHWLAASNMTLGVSITAKADGAGALTLTFPASPGDTLMLFSYSGEDGEVATSPYAQHSAPGYE